MRFKRLPLILLALGCVGFTVPKLTGPVVDIAGIISVSDQQSLDQLLRGANSRGHIQLQILTVPSLEGEVIEQASIQVTNQWKLGTGKDDNGVLLMVARDDRRVRIEVGQGLEGIIPDAYANRIIQDTIVPLFKSGEYSRGVYAGALQILRLADPEFTEAVGTQQSAAYQSEPRRASSPLIKLILFGLFVFLMIFSRGFRTLVLLMLFTGRGGRGGRSSGFGGGSGGSWGGGGGGFSGGGASGSW